MATKPVHFPNLVRRQTYSNYTHYNEFKQEIREDCLFRCVYCDAHEMEIGGEKSLTLDHFRPKCEFKKLEHDPRNLVLACSPCNHLKGNDWPARGFQGTVNGRVGYVDPFEVDRKEYFEVQQDGSLNPLKDPAKYMISSLELNRPFLRFVRQKRDTVYQILLKLENYFDTEIGALLIMQSGAQGNNLELARLNQEIDNLKQCKKMVESLGTWFMPY